MKGKRSADSDKQVVKLSVIKTGIAFCAALLMITGGIVAVYGFGSRNEIGALKANAIAAGEPRESTAESAAEESSLPDESEQETVSVMDWKKADVNAYSAGYSQSDADKVTTVSTTETTAPEAAASEEKATTTTTTTTAKKTEAPKVEEPVKVNAPAKTTTTTTTAAAKEELKFNSFSPKTMYVRMSVNFRKGPSTDYEKWTVLEKNTEVKVSALSADGKWYAAEAEGKSGYIMASYLSDTKIVTTTAATTTAAAEMSAPSGGAVISYNDVDFKMMTYVVQSEVGNCDEKSKLAVCNVMINRVKSNQFPNTLSEILTQKGQFTAVSHYFDGTNPPNQNTIDCCYRALHGEGAEIVNGATFYYTPKYSSAKAAAWFESLCLCASFDGQRFFKNW